MRFKFAYLGAFVLALAACGTADIYNGVGALQSSGSTTGGSTGAPTNGSTTGTDTTGAGTTTGAPVAGSTTTATTGTTTGTTTTGGTTTTTGGTGGNPNNPNTMSPNGFPTNAFFNVVDLDKGQNAFVLVLSTSPDYCTKITENKLPSSSDNVSLEVQSFKQIQPGSFSATQATDDQLDAKCNDTQSSLLPASVAISSIDTSNHNHNHHTATGTVMVTTQGQSTQGSFNAVQCDAISSQDDLASMIQQGLAAKHCD